MLWLFIFALSASLQIAGVLLSISLARRTGRWMGWSLIAAALLSMAVAHGQLAMQGIQGNFPSLFRLRGEFIEVLTSLFYALGLFLVLPLFLFMKKSEERLRESENMFRALAETAPSCIVILRGTGLIYANALVEEVTGYRREELFGSAIWEVVHPDDRKRLMEWAIRRQRGGAPPARYEFRIETKGGEARWMELSASRIQLGGKPAVIDAVWDITERKNAEETERRETIAQADRLKDDFLSVLSHELRTPLNAVMGFGSILDDGLAGPLSEEQCCLISKILASSERMLELVDNLLDFAEIRAGRLILSREETDFGEMARSVIDAHRPAIAEKGLSLELSLPPETLRLSLDARKIQKVLRHLLTNAIKFTPPEGNIEVRCFLDGGQLVTEVEDDGIGISPEDLPKVFSPFRQVDMSSTRPFGGTGLGLTIAKRIVEAHGGSIQVSSPGKNKGTCVRFEIPL